MNWATELTAVARAHPKRCRPSKPNRLSAGHTGFRARLLAAMGTQPIGPTPLAERLGVDCQRTGLELARLSYTGRVVRLSRGLYVKAQNGGQP